MLLSQNIRRASRIFRRSPAFAAVTILTFALGIGANTAIFSVLDAVVLRELPVRQPQQLVELSVIYRNGGRVPFSYPMFQAIERWQRVFEGLYGWTFAMDSSVKAGGVPFLAGVRAVSGNYYSGLGVTPLLGRLIAPEISGGNPQVAVLGYECWLSRFGGARNVIGRSIRIDGRPFTVMGITRPWFAGMTPGEPADITIPITATSSADRGSRSLLWISATGRLRDGVTMEQARTQLASFWPDVLRTTVPTESRGARRQSFLAMRLALDPAAAGAKTALRNRVSRPLYVMMGVVVLILLIACVNLANLTLARAAGRSQEMSTRAALGATRWQIARQLLTESLLFSVGGASLALALAYWGGPLLLSLLADGGLRAAVLDVRPDWRVLAFTAAVAVLTGILVGLVPALQMSRQQPALAIRERGVGRGQARAGKVLIVSQIALSLVLLFGAGLLLRTFQNLRSADPGFQKVGILEAGLHSLPVSARSAHTDEDTNNHRHQLVERAAALPGAISAAFSDVPVPANDNGWRETVSAAGSDSNPDRGVLATLICVSPEFFRTFAMPVVVGRDFDWSDDRRQPAVTIVDSEVARRLFPAGAIGQRVRFGVQPQFQSLEIVGVVRAARLIDLRDASRHAIYIPCQQYPYGGDGHLFVRASHAGTLARALDSEVQSLGREYVTETRTIEQMSDRALVAERAAAIFSTAFATAALMLAGIGLFGLMSYTVTRRTREIGIRMALGSEPGAILRMICRQTLVLTLAGILVGLPGALAATRLLARGLFGLTPFDPLSMAAAAGALLAVGLIAGYLPARRVLRMDPMSALRRE
ncbi:MAG: ABC transporter permease [Bryobacteraceae bacterium]